MNAMSNFDEIEKMFVGLLALSGTKLSQSEQEEIREFINVGEYGLALETAVDIFIEEGKKPPDEVVSLIKKLAVAMGMDPNSLKLNKLTN